ncbi:hypothetical protein [Herbiconiux ginsengi]|uniref:Uncharacterized protein n=1 Tax=Herbiconiux ginsengi TaxID=381665 RepID=A0A1H3TWZ6_9MICO|nr:hypothetical protein [Herbiconiux ginsengi]SDZ54578.1 hypothetical protein SAMN05216554_4553 [Herbiconiux ginsengi]
MGFVDRILGRKRDLEEERTPASASRTPAKPADERAVAEYERLLRTAPPDTIQKVHVEAFSKLTPEQLDILYDRFTANASTAEDRPADARPATLAKTATQVEQKKPGTLQRVLGDDATGDGFNTYLGLSILDTVIWYSIASTLWTGFDAGSGDSGDGGDGGAGGDDGSDGASGDTQASGGYDDSSSGGFDDPSGGGFDGFGGGFDF